MDNTKFIQKSAKTSLNQTSKRMCLDFTAVLSITAIILMVVALISSSIVAEVDAKPRIVGSPDDICIAAGDRCYCSNDTANLAATCCVDNGSRGVVCETCDIDTRSLA